MTIALFIDVIRKIGANDDIIGIEMLHNTVAFERNNPTRILVHAVIDQKDTMTFP